MAKDFHESYEHEIPDMPSDRSTGFVFAVVSAIIGLIFFYVSDYTNNNALMIGFGACGLFTLTSLWEPDLLNPLNKIWFKFSLLLFKIVNPIVMFLMFAIAIVPAGLIMQIKADPLRKKKPENANSYWIDRDEGDNRPSMKNQF